MDKNDNEMHAVFMMRSDPCSVTNYSGLMMITQCPRAFPNGECKQVECHFSARYGTASTLTSVCLYTFIFYKKRVNNNFSYTIARHLQSHMTKCASILK